MLVYYFDLDGRVLHCSLVASHLEISWSFALSKSFGLSRPLRMRLSEQLHFSRHGCAVTPLSSHFAHNPQGVKECSVGHRTIRLARTFVGLAPT